MAISLTRPDPSSPSSVASASFPTARKGFEQGDVREFLRMVAAELARLQERERFLERELRGAQRSATPSSVALDEELVTKMLGEEAARILSTAREAASQIKIRAEEGAARLLREVSDEAQRVREEAEIEAARRRQDAASDAESELEMAKQQGREMVNEARAYRERVLSELGRRREAARQQLEQLIHGRDRLLQAFERARLVAADVMAELTPLGDPSEDVDVSPTAGPVPFAVARPPHDREAEPDAEPDAGPDAGPDPDATVMLTLVTERIDTAGSADATDATDGTDGMEDAAADEAPAPLDITPSDHSDHLDEPDREPARVVPLFEQIRSGDAPGDEHDGELDAGLALELDDEPDDEADTPPDQPDPPDDTVALRASVDDLFARLRAVRADSVAERAIAAEAVTSSSAHAAEAAPMPGAAESTEDSVFMSTPSAPALAVAVDDTPFARREEALTPLIVSAARKLKRVLADEQNDVLHALRGKAPVRTIETMVATEDEQVARYVSAITAELADAAIAGAVSMGVRPSVARREANKGDAIASASKLLATELVAPLRTRLQRCISDADGDNAEMSTLVRLVYREWKTQRIDEHLDDVARTAFGQGALAGVAPGTPICWIVDPAGPQCPDAEDNALAGAVRAGEAFPTDHPCAPAHTGCRCMIVPAPASS